MVVVLVGILVALATPSAAKLIRRSEDMAALASARQVLAVARLEAVKTSSNVVVVVGLSGNLIHLLSFRDRADVTTVSANDGNGVKDAGEPILGEVTLSPRIHFWKQGGTEDSVAGAALFDTCAGDASSRCVVFLPNGGISAPASGLPTLSGGRGIYFADWQGKNYFRVTIESDLSGKARADKYVQGTGYVRPNPVTKWGWL